MIKLQKPSSLSMRGTPSEKCDYLINYLSKLTDEIERAVSSLKNSAGEEKIYVCDISSKDGNLIIRYSDSSIKKIAKE
ncbi:MAG: hypothetical protein IKN26_06960 [Eubacterium sp.]|nr:hypothetical protein [Eubacterium sp.]MBR4241615.1 hypothetical protein [Eubacterium sp.]MBR7061311.1 hypothetical protein [Eubacterium sp.]